MVDREQAATTCRPSRSCTTFKVWAEEAPPKGTLYHYPNPYNHQILSVAGAPAPHKIAKQIYTQAIQTQMAVRYFKGEPWRRRWTGRRANSKASCAIGVAPSGCVFARRLGFGECTPSWGRRSARLYLAHKSDLGLQSDD